MAPLHPTAAVHSHHDTQSPKEKIEPSQNAPPPEAFAFARDVKSLDDNTRYDSAIEEEEANEETPDLLRKVEKYRRRNKQLSDDFKEQRDALLKLEHEYAQLKLELARAQSTKDCNDMAKDEAIASKDLTILELARERDARTRQVRDLRGVEARLEYIIHEKDERLVRLVEQLDNLEQDLRFTIRERDNVVCLLKRLGKGKALSDDHWRRGLFGRACFAPRFRRRETQVEQAVLPVDAIVADSIHNR